jgi:hypothetical protein
LNPKQLNKENTSKRIAAITMYSINDQQIDFILNDIRARGVEMEDLQYNLLDHICCIIEQNLEANGDFERFYQKTVRQFYKHELWEIEEETISLQIFKHYYTMKKIMIGSGIISAIAMIAGIFFKFMHWPGASFLLVIGIGLSSLLFLPLLFTLKIKEKKEAKDRVIIGIGTLAGILMSLGILFKVMHWPGANMMGMGAVLMMLIIFLPVYFFNGIRNPDTRVNTLVSTILIIMGCGLFFTLVNTRPSVRMQNMVAFSNQKADASYRYLTAQNSSQLAIAVKDSSHGKSLTELSALCNVLCNTIEQLKLGVINETEGIPYSKVDYSTLQMPENYDTPTRYLFDNMGIAKPALQELKKKLGELNAMASGNFKVEASQLINLSDRSAVHQDGIEPWEKSSFYHTTEDLVLKNFTQLQLDIRIIEANCLSAS